MWTGERSIVYTEVERHTFMMKEVQLGKDLGEHYEIKKGLDKGDRVVKTGTFVIDAAAQLQGKPSMMNRTSSDESHKASIVSNDVFESYLKATKALQANNEKEVKMELARVLDSIPSMKTKFPHLLHHSGDEFKESFSKFSLSLSKELDLSDVYLLKCPMANSDKGGYRLSDEPEENNPYFGGGMLKCGTIERKINFKNQ